MSVERESERERERERERLMNHSRRIKREKERKEGWVGLSEQAKEREGVLLSSPSNGPRCSSPACCFLSICDIHTHTHSFFGSLARLSVGPRRCLSTFFHPKVSLSFFLRHEDCSSRIRIQEKRQRETQRQKKDVANKKVTEKGREEEDGAPQCSWPAPAVLDRHPVQQYVSSIYLL